MTKFETFNRDLPQLKVAPQITILRRGILSLNKPAHSALGSPDAVELLYDPCERVVGLRPVDPQAVNGYVVRRPRTGGRGPFVITAMAFTKSYDIDTTQSLRWDAFLDADGVLCVCLDHAATPVTSNRARHDDDARASVTGQLTTYIDDVRSMP